MTPSERLQQPDMHRCDRMPGKPTLSYQQCAERYRKSHDPKHLYNPTTKVTFDNLKIPSLFHCWTCEIGKEAAEKYPEDKGHHRPAPLLERRTPVCKACKDARAQSRGFCRHCYEDWRRGKLIEKFGSFYPVDKPHLQEILPGGIKKEKKEEKTPMNGNVAEKLEQGLQEGKEIQERAQEARKASKVCAECGQMKVISEFNRHNRTPDGRFNVCRDCMAKKTTDGLRKKLEEDQAENAWRITIDFSERREIYEVLSAGAEEDERELPRQVLWLVKKTLQERGLLGRDEA